MVFVGYYRVSTDKQENSAEMQPIKLKQFADYKNIELLQVFGDEDVSGGIPFSKREQGAKLIELIESNPNIDGILVTNITRAFRDAVDGLLMLTKWAQEGFKIYVIDEGGTIDVTTPDLSYGSIAEKLNSDNVPTKRNATWHHTSVKKIYIENQNRVL